MVISVFKTSIEEGDLVNLETSLNIVDDLVSWNTDLEDCDNILKVESEKNIAEKIKSILAKQGYLCEELED